MELIEELKSLCKAVNPDYGFEFETSKMMNVRADDARFPLVFFEEYTDGELNIDTYGRMTERTQVELSFMRLAPRENFQCDASIREKIRTQIKQEIVYDFIRALNRSERFHEVTEFRMLPEPPRFDASVVSVLLRFWLPFDIC